MINIDQCFDDDMCRNAWDFFSYFYLSIYLSTYIHIIYAFIWMCTLHVFADIILGRRWNPGMWILYTNG